MVARSEHSHPLGPLCSTIEENNKSIAIGDFKAAPEVAGYSKGASDINERSHKLTSIIESLSGLSVAVACN